MSIFSYFMSGSILKKAQQLTLNARQADGEKADLLFQQAYSQYAAVSETYSQYADALHCWGLALLQQAETKSSEPEAVTIYEEASDKFAFCKTIAPNHLGASADGGVALLNLAKCKQLKLDDELYSKAQKLFEFAESIQLGTSSYNLACLYALQNKSDACLKALENARDHGLVPDKDNIINDVDLKNIKGMPWFEGYIQSLMVDQDEEVLDKDEKIEEKTAEKE